MKAKSYKKKYEKLKKLQRDLKLQNKDLKVNLESIETSKMRLQNENEKLKLSNGELKSLFKKYLQFNQRFLNVVQDFSLTTLEQGIYDNFSKNFHALAENSNGNLRKSRL